MITIGIDIGGTKIEFGAIDEKGRLIKALRVLTEVSLGPKAVIEQIVQGIKELQVPFDAIGVAVAGQVNRKGVVTFAPNLFWSDVPLKEELMNFFSKPVNVVNDVRAATFAEWKFGAGRGCQDLLCVFIGTGIGGGAIMGGQLLVGATGSSLEVGHMQLDYRGPLCTCGSHGCFEALAGGLGLTRQFREAVIKTDPLIDPNRYDMYRIIALYREHDTVAEKLIKRAFEVYIAGFVSLVNLFNPKKLLLGGGVVEGLPEIVEVVRRGIKEKALKSARGVEVKLVELSHPTILGAAFIKNED